MTAKLAEIVALLRVKYSPHATPVPPLEQQLDLDDQRFCYAVLGRVSRSFAVVIQQLPDSLKDAVCVFYLVLRGLDSVEDDMTFDISEKIPLLHTFYTKLEEDGWHVQNVGDSHDYRILLANFHKVISVYKRLDAQYRLIISDITAQMGSGMAEYASKLTVGKMYNVDSVASYDRYCYFVAGLVGLGLSRLFLASGLESYPLDQEERLWKSMGLFLQKTNIIRDYLEDLEQARMWWPKEIWSQYAPELEWFKDNPLAENSTHCLNHLINDALQHVPDCLEYLQKLQNRQIFEFCAIPQVMAMATLAEIYNNSNVFQTNVKIRRGLTCRILLSSSTPWHVQGWFRQFAEQMKKKLPPTHDTVVSTAAHFVSSPTLLSDDSTKLSVVSEQNVKRTCDLLARVLELSSTADSNIVASSSKPTLSWLGVALSASALFFLIFHFRNSPIAFRSISSSNVHS